ncbi:cAMP dependent protein kinase regulatory subunit [Halteromyces radiatus]|uniref:cAMP dependent protein kinase regulatory subunit n=1 Tax=Halteromyces radiatus TaxID=101107 RepID=UPI00221F0A4A|nr:cAMP dependent protein kinase regulatory subunit [Halteromyces radiatus]KAI8097603.1 cAMP dependent protein kinase regulatory subunit [Halteromyces radiatus]
MTIDSNFTFGYVDEYTQLLTDLHNDYCRDEPTDVVQYCADFFNRKLAEQRSQFREQRQAMFNGGNEHHPLATNGEMDNGPDTHTFQWMDSDDRQDDEDEDEDDFDDEERDNFSTAPLNTPMTMPTNYHRDRRTSVSAESIAPSQSQDFIKTVIPKTTEQCDRIRFSVGNNFLFKHLDEEQAQDVVDAMAEKHVESGDRIIEQGGVGDYFYIVESGTFDCFIKQPNSEEQVKVVSYEAGGSFGELALMYNAPRAATIIATSPSVVWALDRITFRTILMEHTSRKRRMYESFLEEVPLLKSLKSYERHKIADALESVYFEEGQTVIKQGDVGDQFYIIESGNAVFYKLDENGVQQEVNQGSRGAYFGELALLNDSPRAATVIASGGRLKCATLGKKAFTRLLGPVHAILTRNSDNYRAVISQQ